MPQDISSTNLSVIVHAAQVVYEGVPLFDSIDLTLPADHWTSLLGPSGVGKSTLLRLIAGLTENSNASRHSVLCDDGRPLDGRVAYMAQQDLLLPWLTAIDNVLLGASLRGGDRTAARDRARSLLDRVGLDAKRNSLPFQLSGGQRQRVALARTLFEDRPIVLMDEPFSALDALTRLRLQDLAASLLEGRAVLLVTHDPLEALRLSDSIRVMTGHPAALSDAPVPASRPPRPPADPAILSLQIELLRKLDAVPGSNL